MVMTGQARKRSEGVWKACGFWKQHGTRSGEKSGNNATTKFHDAVPEGQLLSWRALLMPLATTTVTRNTNRAVDDENRTIWVGRRVTEGRMLRMDQAVWTRRQPSGFSATT